MAAIANITGANGTIKWQAEPETRGTYSILSTCIITLSLCVWSCVHLNLPSNDGSRRRKFFRRLGWFMCALFAPEYLVLVAWNQRETARKISKEAAEAFRSAKKGQGDLENQPLQRQHPWTMTHSFWAIMGGIAIDSNGSSPFIPLSQRSTLTPEGVSLFLKFEPQLLPDISEEDVKDRSKDSSLTKLVACIQAVWFCLSCLTRISQKLHISMLEINAFAHALCAVIVYILWWKKPLDIERPVVISDDRTRCLSAFTWMSSKTSCLPKLGRSLRETVDRGRDPEFEAITDIRSSGEGSATKGAETAPTVPHHPSIFTNRALGTDTRRCAEPPSVVVTTVESLFGTDFCANPQSTRWEEKITTGSGETTYSYTRKLPAVFHLTPIDIRRWHLAREAMDQYGLEKPDKDLNLVTVKTVAEWMTVNSNERKKRGFLDLFGFALVTAGYAGVHGLAWNGHFPSHRQQKLWRIATLVLAGPASLFLAFMLLLYAVLLIFYLFKFSLPPSLRIPIVSSSSSAPDTITTTAEEKGIQKQQKPPRIRSQITKLVSFSLSYSIAFICFYGCMVLYFPARVYLIYESVRTLFYLPPGAYRTPSWPQYLPHIT